MPACSVHDQPTSARVVYPTPAMYPFNIEVRNEVEWHPGHAYVQYTIDNVMKYITGV